MYKHTCDPLIKIEYIIITVIFNEVQHIVALKTNHANSNDNPIKPV